MRFGVKLHVPIYDAVVILQTLVGSCNILQAASLRLPISNLVAYWRSVDGLGVPANARIPSLYSSDCAVWRLVIYANF
ncbi:hypothetical protein SAMN05216255_2881 [Pseudomonas segetis]|uniref:Uncharacterized protein n=1 Tax=Pseudomonas segetis TaxID=298908 RepID=A0A239G1F7_9PSED|nr:hypothetical protein SAMN05216255_2881 [Pseudomonas segetis]